LILSCHERAPAGDHLLAESFTLLPDRHLPFQAVSLAALVKAASP
jgi:hypothetical protein